MIVCVISVLNWNTYDFKKYGFFTIIFIYLSFESTIMSPYLQNLLIELCGFKKNQKWELKNNATRDWFKASNVHAKLTLTVIKADSGKIFVTDHSAFIFSLVNKEKSSLVNKYVQSRMFKWLSICNKL